MAMKRLDRVLRRHLERLGSTAPATPMSRVSPGRSSRSTARRQGIAQIVFYQSGVGTEGASPARSLGGALGLGLAHNMRDAYTFICNNYCEGDEIFLFGFSRGAYTARSIGGLIGFAGLLGKQRSRPVPGAVEGLQGQEPGRARELRQAPQNVPDQMHRRLGHGRLGRHPGGLGEVRSLLQAVLRILRHATSASMSSMPFTLWRSTSGGRLSCPTLWTQTPDGKARGQELKQVWFAGVHSDVGGGYPEHGTSDIPLAWMASEVSPYLGLDFEYLKARRDLSGKWALGMLHELFKESWTKLGEERRTPFAADRKDSFEKIHASVAARIKGGGLGAAGRRLCERGAQGRRSSTPAVSPCRRWKPACSGRTTR